MKSHLIFFDQEAKAKFQRILLPIWAMMTGVCLLSGPDPAVADDGPGENPFLILADVSGSMRKSFSFRDKSGELHEMPKSKLVKMLLRDIMAQLAASSRVSGIYRFRIQSGKTEYYRPFVDIGSHGQTEVTEWISDTFETDFPIFDRLTSIGGTLRQLDEKLLESMHGQISVLLISDGEENFYDLEVDARGGESENLSKAMVELRRLKKKYGKRFILHTLFVGGERKKRREFAGKPLLEKMARIGSGWHFDGRELFGNLPQIGELCALAGVATLDSDNDGVVDGLDKCPGTPDSICADENGCPGCREKIVLRKAAKKADDAIPTALDDFQPGPPLDLDCAKNAGGSPGLVSEMKKGEDFYLVGDFESAAESWERALARKSAKTDLCKYTETLIRLAAAYQALGRHREALKMVEAGIQVIERGNDPNLMALAWSTLADIWLSLGRTGQSALCQEKVFDLIESVNHRLIFTNVLLNAANALAVDGDYEASMAYYRVILGYYQDCISQGDLEEINPKQRSKVLLNVIRLKYEAMDYSDMEMLLEEAFQRIARQPDSVDKSADLISFALLCFDIREGLARPGPGDEITEPVKFEIKKKPKPAEFAIAPLETGITVNIEIPRGHILKKLAERRFTVFFDLGEYDLSERAQLTLDEISAFLKTENNNATHMHVRGSADAVPVRKDRKDYTSNLELSLKRIESVERYLEKRMAGTSEPGEKIWKYGLMAGKFSNKAAAMAESRRLKEKYGAKTAIAETIRSNKKHHVVYTGEFDSVRAASDFSTRTFQKQHPVEKTGLIQTLQIKDGEKRIVILKEAAGCFNPEVENSLSVSGTPENRRADISIALLNVVKEEDAFVDLDKIDTNIDRRFVGTGNEYSLEALHQEQLFEKSLYRHLTEISFLALNEARQIVGHMDIDRLSPAVFGYMSRLYKSEQFDDRAMYLTRRAVNEAQQADFPDVLYRWQWQLGKEYRDAGEIEKAIAEYRKALATLNPIKYKFFQGYRIRKNIFKESVKPVYLELADLLLEQADSLPKGVSRQMKLKEVRDLVEMLKTSELEDFYRDECVTRREEGMVIPDAIVPPQTAVIHPIVMPDKLALLLTLPDGLSVATVPVDETTLELTVSDLRKKLQNRLNNRFLDEAEHLYDWIIRPIESELAERDIHTLSFAPDGALRMVPMATLYDGRSFLVEKYAISVIPFMKLIDFDAAPKKSHRILLAGISEARQGFSALPAVPVELNDIKAIMNGETVLMNETVVCANLEKAIGEKEYSILHIATHGVFGRSPEESFLLEYNNRLNMNDLEKLLGTAKNPIDLLTLSACQTALGNERAAMGLAGVAVKSGVKSALATLWYVDDEATSSAIREFYRQLNTNISKAEALQNTQKAMIAGHRFWHPLYWAPFVIIGNWM